MSPAGDSTGFSVTNPREGRYEITFNIPYSSIPAITGNQVNLHNNGQWDTDGVVFPYVTKEGATVVTGDSGSTSTDPKQKNRAFSFFVYGDVPE